MRYKNSIVKKSKDGVRYYKPTIVPNIPIKDSDIFIFPVYGDRFDTIAYRYYGDSNLWWIIAKANELSKKRLIFNSQLLKTCVIFLKIFFGKVKKLNS